MPLVSVIMACYNSSDYLSEAVNSILEQTYKNFEFIIVNDGSTDKTGEILNKYEVKDNRIKIITNQECLGLTKSLIIAVEKSSGKLIARQDADDLSDPIRLQKQVQFFEENKQHVLIGTGSYHINEEGKTIILTEVITGNNKIKSLLNHGNVFVHGSVMFRRKSYEKVSGYDKRMYFSQDYDLWLKLKATGKFDIIPERLYNWRVNENSISSKRKDAQIAFSVLALLNNKYNNKIDIDEILSGKEDFNKLFNLILKQVKDLKDKEMYSDVGNLLIRSGVNRESRFFLIHSRKIIDIIKALISMNTYLFNLSKKIYIKYWL